MTQPPIMNHPQISPIERWRVVALEFHAIQWFLNTGMLRPDFEPVDLARFRKRPDSGAVRGIFAFLLHIYNSANRFDLSEIQRWDDEHRKAFTRWVTGQTTGEPCHYF